MQLEQELQRLATKKKEPLTPEQELPVEGEWTEWSPVPFGRVPSPMSANSNQLADPPALRRRAA